MTKEDRSHRNHAKNPRKWPIGPEVYTNDSKGKIWERLNRIALLSEPEMKLIQSIPSQLGSGLYANLGHARGGSAILLADGIREDVNVYGKVYSIDLFKAVEQRRSLRTIKEFDLENLIELCVGSTNDWATQFTEERKRFNFVFIDADHTYDAVKNDFNKWSKLVRLNGLIAFHDVNQDFSHKAIEETVVKDPSWEEVKRLHIHRIRVFKRISNEHG